ncbi:unnamed protein product [Lathyrus oleraceus]|uniref:Aspergillus nuclease S1 n=1 Tax=Pisum sativum TaxID=3888 RepID=A0A9D4YCM1_PEA|nr:endonuclease 2-like [Pisum sativum]KAI5436054.1 hypothetical protein KIW84_022482 [Pisum sativum]
MGLHRIQLVLVIAIATVSFMLLLPNTQGWGEEGHYTVCKIAQARLSNTAAEAVKELLPKSAENDLASMCSWPDNVRKQFPWSSSLHFANTPDLTCNYQNERDCMDARTGAKGRCVVGAITNYTNQLLHYGSNTESTYNLTESLLFLSHFMGDIHQPLHCGFLSDKGGNTIIVQWFENKQNLHQVWDNSIIESEVERFYNSELGEFIDAIQTNIMKVWGNQVEEWENCISNDIACPITYASESNEDACKWAYKDAAEGSVLEDDYFRTRFPIINLRLAQGGIRLAATLNRIFDKHQYVMSL